MDRTEHPAAEPQGSTSAALVRMLVLWLFTYLGCTTILTHLAQIVALRFREYAFACLLLLVLVSGWFFFRLWKLLRRMTRADFVRFLPVLLVGIIGLYLSISIYRVGRMNPDEYYYGASAVYALQHPDQPMGFQIHTFYSRDPISGVAFFTSGAYEYLEAAAAFLLQAGFAKVYYVFFSGLHGFVIVWALYLAVQRLIPDQSAAAAGTLGAVIVLVLLGETSVTPGAFSFVRAYEGVSFVTFAGIPLFLVLSLDHFEQRSRVTWLALAAVLTAFAGISTSAFMLFPLLGLILFVSYAAVYRAWTPSLPVLLSRAFFYFSTFGYFLLYGLFVLLSDRSGVAISANLPYPDSLGPYMAELYSSSMPSTAVLVLLFSVLALVLTNGKTRRLLGAWMLLVIVVVFNPWAARVLLHFFRGIYYRLFYIYPFPLTAGLAFAALYGRTRALEPLRRSLVWISLSALLGALMIWLPSSLFRGSVYAWGGTYRDENMSMAREALAVVPQGVMLSPFPVSGAINMIDSGTPQMVTRRDILGLYLNPVQPADAQLRIATTDFLNGKLEQSPAFLQLLTKYPEIQSVVLYRKIVGDRRNAAVVQAVEHFLRSSGFLNRKFTPDLVVYWK